MYAHPCYGVPQTAKLPGKSMVTGKAGGQVFAIDDLMRLQRFLVLGSDGGTYYTKPRQHTAENIAALLRLL